MTVKPSQAAAEALIGDQLLRVVAYGHSVAAAARQLDIPEKRAYRIYHKALAKVYKENAGIRQELVGRELKTLDMLQTVAMPLAMKGDLKALDKVMDLLAARAKYLDLYAATKVDVSISRVDEVVSEIARVIDGSIAGVSAPPLLRALPSSG